MNRRLKLISLAILSLALLAAVYAQSPISQILQPDKDKSIQPATDPLGRETPNGTLFGFLQAAQAENYTTAAQYLQLSPARRASQGEQFSKELKTVLDGAFVGSLRFISTSPEGISQPGLPTDHQRGQFYPSGDSE